MKAAIVCKKDKCAGCMACVECCPKGAITIVDNIVSYNAEIDKTKCIECGICHRVCHINNPPLMKKPITWKQGWTHDTELRKHSSSGGAAAEIERAFIRSGGVVFSCKYAKGEFIFSLAENEEETKVFAGSKYVKSNPAGVYKRIQKYLDKGIKVLFVGLPCQIAAVRNYTSDNQLLMTADLICHGTPSPRLLHMFLNEHKVDTNLLKNLKFRTKGNCSVVGKDHRLVRSGIRDFYIKTFLESVDYTENCYSCPFAKFERVSDITLGDSWGSDLDRSQRDLGISLILCQTQQGIDLINKTSIQLYDVDIEKAIEINDQLRHPSVKPAIREKFLKGITGGKKFERVMFECYPKQYIKNIIKMILMDLHFIQERERSGIIFSLIAELNTDE